MAHELESMFFIGKTPWHGLGHYIGDEAVDSITAFQAAGLDWTVSPKNIYLENGNFISSHKAICRDIDNSILGIVGNKYVPMQNIDAFRFMDSMVTEGKIKYHTAGSLQNGKKVFLLGKISNIDVIPGDTLENYIFLYNSHDGSSALRVMLTPIRVVCMNTARLALSSNSGFKGCHTLNLDKKSFEAANLLGLAQKEFVNFSNWAKYLTTKSLTQVKKLEFLDELITPNSSLEELSKRASFIREETKNKIGNLIDQGIGQEINNVRGTFWAAYNGVTEYVNYFTPVKFKSQEARVNNLLFNNNLIDKASKILIKMAA